MKMYQFDRRDNFNIVKTDDETSLTELRGLGYSETIEGAKKAAIDFLNTRLDLETNAFNEAKAKYLIRIDFIKNF